MKGYICENCGAKYPKWVGKCSECNQWGTIVEDRSPVLSQSSPLVSVLSLNEVSVSENEGATFPSGFSELDRVLGNGFVKGEVILLSGDPGIGKSTLLMQVAIKIALQNKKVVYVSAEESPSQIMLRTKRIHSIESLPRNLRIICSEDIDSILVALDEEKAEFVIFDSVPMMQTGRVSGTKGSVLQTREITSLLVMYAKTNSVASVLVNHITKEGSIAGPKVLEHMVDAVFYMQGEKFRDFRILKSYKNRFGAVDEVGIFKMNDKGYLDEVKNPSMVFMDDISKEESGVCSIVVMEGTRPLILEIQALCVKTYSTMPRRVANGVDYARLQMLCAVISKKMNLNMLEYEVYANIVGGISADEPATDLGLCASIFSSYDNTIIQKDIVFIGEVGLAGEVRGVNLLEKRIREAKRLGYKRAVVSSSASIDEVPGISLVKIKNISNLSSILK